MLLTLDCTDDKMLRVTAAAGWVGAAKAFAPMGGVDEDTFQMIQDNSSLFRVAY